MILARWIKKAPFYGGVLSVKIGLELSKDLILDKISNTSKGTPLNLGFHRYLKTEVDHVERPLPLKKLIVREIAFLTQSSAGKSSSPGPSLYLFAVSGFA